jgi:hypothetical protein
MRQRQTIVRAPDSERGDGVCSGGFDEKRAAGVDRGMEKPWRASARIAARADAAAGAALPSTLPQRKCSQKIGR